MRGHGEGEPALQVAVESADEAPGEDEALDGDALEVEALLASVLEARDERLAEAPPARIDGVVVGALVAVEAGGAVRVRFPGGPEEGLVARAMAALGPEDVGRAVALLFEGGDPALPVVMGKMHAPHAAQPAQPVAQADGERIELRAEKEIVLACGDASITLTRAGKILIRGAYVLSRSSGVHRIQGGSVQIN